MTRPELGLDELPTRMTIDKVPVLHVPSPGLVRAGLVFGVGQAHETFPTRGASHLVEHLALGALGKPAHENNGMVDLATTTFVTHGTPADVARFLTRITAALADLPVERLDLEKRILRTEAAGKSMWPLGPLYVWRFGARAQGLVNNFEYGIHHLSPDDLRDWAVRHFNATNAVLWIAGDVPDDIELHLPRGIPTPPAPVDPVPYNLPGWAPYHGAPGAALSALMEPGAPTGAFLHFLQDAASEHLRHREGVSYSVQACFDRLTHDVNHVSLWADALPTHAPAVADGLVATLERMAETPPSAEELAKHCHWLDLYYREPDAPIQYLVTCAQALVLGAELKSRQQLLDAVRALAPEDIAAATRKAMASAIVLVADGVEFLEERLLPLPLFSDAVVDGKHLRPVLSEGETTESRGTLIVGTEGVSVVYTDGPATVRFAQLAGAVTWPNGSWMLVGNDGITVGIVPTAWENGWTAVEEIEGRLEPSMVVRVQDEDQQSEPEPAPEPAVPPQDAPRSIVAWLGGGWRAALILIAMLLVIVIVSALAGALVA